MTAPIMACTAAAPDRQPAAYTPREVRRSAGAWGTAGSENPSSPFGKNWIFVAIAGFDGPLPSPAPIAGFVMTVEGQRVTGSTACNRMTSGYDIDESRGSLRFTRLRNSRALCDRVAADTEEAVLEVMIATDSFRISDGALELYGKGALLARLEAH